MANPTIAEALLDRLVQPVYRIKLKGTPCEPDSQILQNNALNQP